MFSTNLKAKSSLKPEPARKGRRGDPPKQPPLHDLNPVIFFKFITEGDCFRKNSETK
nr:MAG TPA: hypothetical protein [Inoviridae sp.]